MANFKNRLFALALLLVPALTFGESQSIPRFRGLNNADAAVLIGDDQAQDLQDVDITASGSGIRKRSGYTQFRTIGTSTSAVRGGYYFRDASANDVVVNANNRSIFKSVNGAAYAAFVTTDTAGSYYDFTDSNGYLWRANSSRDTILRYDGTTVTYYPSTPKGDQIEALPSRLAISGTTANPNRVHFSAEADFTDFATGTDETSAFTEDFGLPGQKINAIKWAFGGLLAWTKTTTSMFTFQNQFAGEISDISFTVGTNQPYSVVYDQGIVYWQGQDRHFYAFDGNTMRKISEPLDVSGIVNGESRSWLTSSQTEFETGTIGSGLSATASPGDMLFADVTIDAFTDGDFTASPAWTPYDLVNATVNVVSGKLKISSNPDPPSSAMTGAVYYNYGSSAGSWVMDITFHENSGLTVAGFALTNATPLDSADACSGTMDGYRVVLNDFSSVAQVWECVNGSESAAHISSAYSFSNDVTYTARLDRNSSGEFNLYINSVLIGSFTDTTTTDATFISLIEDTACSGSCASGTFATFDNIKFSLFSGATYQSQSFNVGTAISQWGTFDVNNVLNSGTISYVLYVDTDTSITTSNALTFTSSQTITSGSIPTVAVGPYAVWTAAFTRTASTQNPTLNDVTVNWFEGSVTKHWGTVDKDHRIMWSVAEGTATVPNVTYIYDPRFDSWLKYSVPFDAPARVGDSIYFGDTDEGKVYKWPSGNSDDGSAITAYWKSKDFIGGDPFIEKIFTKYSFLGKEDVGSNIDITYTINGTAASALNYSLTDPLSVVSRSINSNLPSGTKGSFISWKFGNDDADAPFEVYGFKFDWTPQSWRVLP